MPSKSNTTPSASGTNGPQGPPIDMHGGRKKVYTLRNTAFTVDPHYDVIKAIGLGAYGLVVSAKDTRKDRYCAIKRVSHLFEDLIDSKRVLREMKIMRHLGPHPDLIELYDVLPPCEETDRERGAFSEVYVVTALMDTDMRQIIKSTQKLTFAHHAHFAYHMLRGTAYIHSAGVIHRDLKPANILLDGNCEMRICDFGLARAGLPVVVASSADATVTTTSGLKPTPQELTDYVVTRWYRAPELLIMAPYHHAVDVWSIGCILAELLLRRPLFQGRDYMHQLALIAEVVDMPSTPESVAAAAPMTSIDQQTYVAGLAAQQQHKAAGVSEGYTFPSGGESSSDGDGSEGAEEVAPPPSLAVNRRRLFASFGLSPDRCSKTWGLVVDLIARTLAFDAAERVTAAAALRHPYMAHLFAKEAGERTAPLRHPCSDAETTTTAWEFDHRDVGEVELRAMFWEEMLTKGAAEMPPSSSPVVTDADGKPLGSEAFFATDRRRHAAPTPPPEGADC